MRTAAGTLQTCCGYPQSTLRVCSKPSAVTSILATDSLQTRWRGGGFPEPLRVLKTRCGYFKTRCVCLKKTPKTCSSNQNREEKLLKLTIFFDPILGFCGFPPVQLRVPPPAVGGRGKLMSDAKQLLPWSSLIVYKCLKV